MGFDGNDIDWGALNGEIPDNGFNTSTTVTAPMPPDFAGLGNTGGPADMANNDAIKKFLASLAAGTTSVAGQGGQQTPASATPVTDSKLPNNMADLASVIGAFSSGEKANRIVKGNFTQNYDKLALDAQAGRNATESDALKKLGQTAYLLNGGSKYVAPAITLNGKTYKPFDNGVHPPPVSAAQMAGAKSLQDQLGARLAPGGTYSPQPLSSYADPGLAEKLASDASAGVGGLGSIFNLIGQSGQDSVLSKLAGLFKGGGNTPTKTTSDPFGKPPASGGDIGKLLSNIFNRNGGIDGSGNKEDTRMEDQRAFGPDGQPLPTQPNPYYDDATGQYIDPTQGTNFFTGDDGDF